jgi:hypothetical protein
MTRFLNALRFALETVVFTLEGLLFPSRTLR